MSTFEIVSRDRWGSTSKWRWGNMTLPARGVYLHHSVTATTAYPYRDMKKVEDEGIARFGQMSYSYGVHRSGVIMEGAGTKIGAHTANQNSTSFGIVLIGDYDDAVGTDVWLTPTPIQIEAVQWLIYHLKIERNWLLDSAVLQPHKAAPGAATVCPGNKTMPLLPEFRKVWTPPVAPAPTPVQPIVVGITQEVDMQVTNVTLNLTLDNNGNGWIKVPYLLDNILSLFPHSGTRPGADGHYDPAADIVSATPEEGGTIIVIRNGNPGGVTPVWMRVLT